MLKNAPSDVSIFWSAYDPLDLASGSIDVLGFQRGYIALADKILPGFTTVTSSPRYLSMLCAAIATSEERFPDSAISPIKLRHQRLSAVKSYERAWALACEMASLETRIGRQAVDGLRGIQSVRRRLSELSSREKYIRTDSFNLLTNQVRYGGLGAYSAMLEELHLASMRSLSLRPLGFALAEAFPRPTDSIPLYDESKPLSLDGLLAWGRECHLGSFGKTEAKTLKEALRGGEESGWNDDVRWTMLRYIARFSDEEYREKELLNALLEAFENGTAARFKGLSACEQQIHATLLIIRPFEMLYQACQFLFDSIRAVATDEPEASVQSLAKKTSVSSTYRVAQSSVKELFVALQRASELHAKAFADINGVFIDTEIQALMALIESCRSVQDWILIILERHRDVQKGKFDKGERKSPWVQRASSGDTFRLTAQRYQLPVSERWEEWKDVPWHPYRTLGARRFIRRCDIR